MGGYDVVSIIIINGLFIIVAVACVGHYGFWCNDPSRPGWPDRDRVRLSFEGYKPWIRRWPVQNANADDRMDDAVKFTVNTEGVVVPLDIEEGVGGGSDSRPPATSKGPELKAKQPPPRPKAAFGRGAATAKPTSENDAAKLSLKERRTQEKTEGSKL